MQSYVADTKGYVCSDVNDLLDQIVRYELKSATCAVIGRAVHRSIAILWMDGQYVFRDSCIGQVSAVAVDADARQQTVMFADASSAIGSFGFDVAGAAYVLMFDGPLLQLSDRFRDSCGRQQSCRPIRSFHLQLRDSNLAYPEARPASYHDPPISRQTCSLCSASDMKSSGSACRLVRLHARSTVRSARYYRYQKNRGETHHFVAALEL